MDKNKPKNGPKKEPLGPVTINLPEHSQYIALMSQVATGFIEMVRAINTADRTSVLVSGCVFEGTETGVSINHPDEANRQPRT